SVAVLFVALRPLARVVRRSSHLLVDAGLDFTAELNEAVSLAADSRTYGVIGAEEKRVDKALLRIGGPWKRVQRAHGLLPGAYQTAAATFLLIGLAVVAASGTTSFARLGAVVLILLRALASSQQLQYCYQRMGETVPFVDRICDTIDRLEASRQTPGSVRVQSIERVALEEVSFRYSADRPA